jgi:hypothetical protein
MQFETYKDSQQVKRKEAWILKDVYVELEGDKIRFFEYEPNEDEMLTKDVRN